jgi:hypothetical protein
MLDSHDTGLSMSGVTVGYLSSGKADARVGSTGWEDLTSLGTSEGVNDVEGGTREFARWVGIGFAV